MVKPRKDVDSTDLTRRTSKTSNASSVSHIDIGPAAESAACGQEPADAKPNDAPLKRPPGCRAESVACWQEAPPDAEPRATPLERPPDSRAESAASEQEPVDPDRLLDQQAGRRFGETGELVKAFDVPIWLDALMLPFGVIPRSDMVMRERDRRADELFVNPYPKVWVTVTSIEFEALVAVVVMLNCVIIVFEASLPPEVPRTVFEVLEHLFVAFFLGEWCLRMTAFGWTWPLEFYNFCDTMLVFGTGVLIKWMLEPLGFEVPVLRNLAVLRMLRLVRLLSKLRMKPAFKELWILVYGLATAARPLFWTLLILLILLFSFAVMATQLIGRVSAFQDDEHVQELFGDLPSSMLTMFQVMTLDSYFPTVVRPVMAWNHLLGLFFISFVLVGVFVFWNVVTAVIVDSVFVISKLDHEKVVKELELATRRELGSLADTFLQLDKDGSGDLTQDELAASMKHPKMKQVMEVLEMSKEDMMDSWQIMDDGDGVLTIMEFARGIRRMYGPARQKDMMDVSKRLSSSVEMCGAICDELAEYKRELRQLEAEANVLSQDTGLLVGLLHEVYVRLSSHEEDLNRAARAEAQRQKAMQIAHVRMKEAGDA